MKPESDGRHNQVDNFAVATSRNADFTTRMRHDRLPEELSPSNLAASEFNLRNRDPMTAEERHSPKPPVQQEFEDQSRLPQPGLLREFGEFILHNKKWWLIPLLLAITVLMALAFLTNSVAAPFI
ncbi:MAG: hypothetical protein DWQ29_00615, partial [Planctomycetota bacterium]